MTRSLLSLAVCVLPACVSSSRLSVPSPHATTGANTVCAAPGDDKVVREATRNTAVDTRIRPLEQIPGEADLSISEKDEPIRDVAKEFQTTEEARSRVCATLARGEISHATYDESIRHSAHGLVDASDRDKREPMRAANADDNPLLLCATGPEHPPSFAELRAAARCRGCNSDFKDAASWASPRISAKAEWNGSQGEAPTAFAEIGLTCSVSDGGYQIGVEGQQVSYAAGWPRRYRRRVVTDRWAESTISAHARMPFHVTDASTYCLVVRKFDKSAVYRRRDAKSYLFTPKKSEPTFVTLQNPAGLTVELSAGSHILLGDSGEWTVVVELDSRYRSDGTEDVAHEVSNTLDVVFAAKQADRPC